MRTSPSLRRMRSRRRRMKRCCRPSVGHERHGTSLCCSRASSSMLIFLLHRRTIELIILTGDLGGKPPSGRPVTSPEGSDNGAQASSLNLAPASAGVFGAFQSECRHSDYLRRVLVGELLK